MYHLFVILQLENVSTVSQNSELAEPPTYGVWKHFRMRLHTVAGYLTSRPRSQVTAAFWGEAWLGMRVCFRPLPCSYHAYRLQNNVCML